ncbi:MAG: mycoredoxin [Mycobacteriales bacterium]
MPLTIYSTSWCGYCTRLKRQLDREGVSFLDVDIEADPQAEDFVRRSNDGSATVPTVAFPDGTTMTNPSLREVLDRVRSWGIAPAAPSGGG